MKGTCDYYQNDVLLSYFKSKTWLHLEDYKPYVFLANCRVMTACRSHQRKTRGNHAVSCLLYRKIIFLLDWSDKLNTNSSTWQIIRNLKNVEANLLKFSNNKEQSITGEKKTLEPIEFNVFIKTIIKSGSMKIKRMSFHFILWLDF